MNLSLQKQNLAYQAFGLAPVDPSLPPAERCAQREAVIDTCLELPQVFWLRSGQELYALKYSPDKEFIHSSIWSEDDKARGWKQYLKKRFQVDRESDKSISDMTATSWMQWAVLHPQFVQLNTERAERGLLPVPIPSSASQLRPFASLMRRVDDWVEPNVVVPGAPTAGDSQAWAMEPPYAEDQSEVIAAWIESYESIPPDKRIRKGEPRPPAEMESRDYLRTKQGLQQLKAREEREIEEANQDALTVGEKPADPGKQPAAAAPPRAKVKTKPAPKKSAEELKAERRQYQIEQDVRSYRLKLNNLQESAEYLEAFIKNTLAREGSESYLRELRQLDLGIFSVDDDMTKLRNAVMVCQSVYKLITEPYTPPTPISREDAAADAVIDL
jgi:hypothetical protein